MAKNPDFLKTYIKSLLLPVVADDGFSLYATRDLVRVNSPFIDVMSFQLSQYGNKSFHVHYHKHLVSNPLVNLDSYSVGYRLSDNRKSGDDTDWCALGDDQAKHAIESVVDAYDKTIKPWFDDVTTIADYFFEFISINHNASVNSFDHAVGFAHAGKYDRAWWIFSDLLQGEESTVSEEAIPEAQKQLCRQYCDASDADSALALVDPASAGLNVDSLLEAWAGENIERLRLPSVRSQ